MTQKGQKGVLLLRLPYMPWESCRNVWDSGCNNYKLDFKAYSACNVVNNVSYINSRQAGGGGGGSAHRLVLPSAVLKQ